MRTLRKVGEVVTEHFFIFVGAFLILLHAVLGFCSSAQAAEPAASISINDIGRAEFNLISIGLFLVGVGSFLEAFRRIRQRVSSLEEVAKSVLMMIERLDGHIAQSNLHEEHGHLATMNDLRSCREEERISLRAEVKAGVIDALREFGIIGCAKLTTPQPIQPIEK